MLDTYKEALRLVVQFFTKITYSHHKKYHGKKLYGYRTRMITLKIVSSCLLSWTNLVNRTVSRVVQPPQGAINSTDTNPGPSPVASTEKDPPPACSERHTAATTNRYSNKPGCGHKKSVQISSNKRGIQFSICGEGRPVVAIAYQRQIPSVSTRSQRKRARDGPHLPPVTLRLYAVPESRACMPLGCCAGNQTEMI